MSAVRKDLCWLYEPRCYLKMQHKTGKGSILAVSYLTYSVTPLAALEDREHLLHPDFFLSSPPTPPPLMFSLRQNTPRFIL